MQTIEILEDLVEKGSENMDVRNKEEVVLRMRSAVASKQFGQEDDITVISITRSVVLEPAPA